MNVEYVSANPTGPMHVGHCRGAVVGDALANLLARAGFAVTKEYYVNDAGAQVAALAWVAYWRYLEALGTPMTEAEFEALVPGGRCSIAATTCCRSARRCRRARRCLADAGTARCRRPPGSRRCAASRSDSMLGQIRDDLARLGVSHDVFTSERAILAAGAADAAIDRLEQAGLLYEGVLEPPKGKRPPDWEARPQTLFRATAFGDDVDRPLRKADGSNTYFANDIGYHGDKIARGADVLIDVLGADHGGYVARMRAAVQAIAPSYAPAAGRVRGGALPDRARAQGRRADADVEARRHLRHAARPARRGRPRRRALHHADPQAGRADGVRPRPGGGADPRQPGVLRAVRPCPLPLGAARGGRDAGARRPLAAALAEAPLDALQADAELALVRRLGHWPRLLEGAALAREPHRIAFYLNDLAGDFHMLWNRGRDDATLRFLQADAVSATRARLALVAATAMVIRSGLAVLGVTPVEEMR